MLDAYIKNGHVAVRDERGEFLIEPLSNNARNCFSYELDETWLEAFARKATILVEPNTGQPFVA